MSIPTLPASSAKPPPPATNAGLHRGEEGAPSWGSGWGCEIQELLCYWWVLRRGESGPRRAVWGGDPAKEDVEGCLSD